MCEWLVWCCVVLCGAAIFMAASDKDRRDLRAKAMECIGIVGKACGVTKFLNDAKQVMQMLITRNGRCHMTIPIPPLPLCVCASEPPLICCRLLCLCVLCGGGAAQGYEGDDPQALAFVQTASRICQAIGDDFLPYLPTVIPALLKSAQLENAVVIHEEGEKNKFENEEGYKTVPYEVRNHGTRVMHLFPPPLLPSFLPLRLPNALSICAVRVGERCNFGGEDHGVSHAVSIRATAQRRVFPVCG
jgi:hypothetical protein